MDSIWESLQEKLREILSGMIMKNLGDMLSSVNAQAAELGGEVAMSPSAWNPSIWTMVQNVTDIAIVPISALILTYAMCAELISLVNDKNNLHNTGEVVGMFMKYIIKLGIGVMLVQRATEITMGIFDLSAFAITKSMGVVVTSSGELAVELAAVQASLQDAELGALMSLAFTSQLGKIGMTIVGIVVKLIIAGRMIEIYIYCACGSAPYATLTSKQLSGIGGNYIKNLLALAFQGFFMFIMLGIYVALMQSTINSVTGTGEAEVVITEVILISAALCIRAKSDFILSFCEQILGGRNGLEPLEVSVIDRCVQRIYAQYNQDPCPERMPILGDLYECLLAQPEPEAQRIATGLELYVTGSLNVFNHRTNVDINNRLVCFDTQDLGSHLQKLGMLIVQDQIWSRVTVNRAKGKYTRYYADEFHLMLEEPVTAAATVTMWKRFRKWGGMPTAITQNVSDFLQSAQVKGILKNSEFFYLLGQSRDDQNILADELEISSSQMRHVNNVEHGEGLIIFRGTIIPFKNEFPKDTQLYRLMTTKLTEVT